MFGIPLGLVIGYSTFSLFHYYQLLHAKNFRGSSNTFNFVLSSFGFLCMIFMYGFLIYVWYKSVWYYPLILFGIGFVLKNIFFALEAYLNIREYYWVFSIIGFVAIPISIIFMIMNLP